MALHTPLRSLTSTFKVNCDGYPDFHGVTAGDNRRDFPSLRHNPLPSLIWTVSRLNRESWVSNRVVL
jgi:hypothetical protein